MSPRGKIAIEDQVGRTDVALPRGEFHKYRFPAGRSILESVYTGRDPVGIVVTPLARP